MNHGTTTITEHNEHHLSPIQNDRLSESVGRSAHDAPVQHDSEKSLLVPHRSSSSDTTLDGPHYGASIPPECTTSKEHQDVLQVAIKTAVDAEEPHAPEIHVISAFVGEITPSFPFRYTNKMHYSGNVPKPSLQALVGCDCIGGCTAQSSTCTCLQRQMRYMEDAVEGDFGRGFAYGLDGRVRTEYIEYPIFECNDRCRCNGVNCHNRVVQKGRAVSVDIMKTEKKGWGVFSAQLIPKHTFIGVCAGEYLTHAEGIVRELANDHTSRSYLFDVNFWYLKQPPVWHGSEDSWTALYCVDSFRIGNFTRFLNHSCDPNCIIVPVYTNEDDLNRPLLTVWTDRQVEALEELCISYVGDTDALPRLSKKQRRILKAKDGICQCGTKKCKGRLWRV